MAGFSIGGNDWLGIGATGSTAYQGTEECGSRPNCLWTKSCKERQQQFADCVDRSLAMKEKMLDSELNNRNAPQANDTKKTAPALKNILIIGGILLLLILIIRR